MAETTDNSTQSVSKNGGNLNKTQSKKKQRRQLPTPNQTNNTRNELTINMKVSTTSQMVSSKHFELYAPFVLNPESNELYIKVDKNAIVSLVTGNKFSSDCTGYKISL